MFSIAGLAKSRTRVADRPGRRQRPDHRTLNGTAAHFAAPESGKRRLEEFETRIAECIPRLRRYARVLTGNAGTADDLVQDTLERSWSRLHLWQPGTDLRAWLFTIMHNVYVNRRRRREPERFEADFEPTAVGTQEQQLELRDLARALARLPADYREVLLLVAVEEMRYAQIADVLRLPLGTVMSRLSRARAHLHTLMNGEAVPPLRRIK